MACKIPFPQLIMLTISLWLGSSSIYTYGQSKKEILFTLDSLKNAYNSLQSDYKTLKAEKEDYNNFYYHVKSQILTPAEMDFSIEETYKKWLSLTKDCDSIHGLDSLIADSIIKLTNNNLALQTENQIFKNLINSSIDEATIPLSQKELIGKWNLYMNLLQIEGSENDSGIIANNPFFQKDSIFKQNISMIEFQKEELAIVSFRDGTTIKCFYSIKDFNTSSPYHIYLTKQDQFKLTLLISPMPQGLMASYEYKGENNETGYFYGPMKK